MTSIDLFFNILQLTGGIILTLGYVPQIVKIIKTRDVNSFSISSLSLVAFGILLMQIYATNLVLSTGKGVAFLITNTLSLLCSISVLILVVKFKNRISKV